MVQRTYTYSSPIIRKAIWELTWLTQGGMLLGLIVLLIIAVLIAIGDHPLLWLSGFIAGFAIAYFVLVLRSYLYSARRIKKYEGIEIHVRFYDLTIAIDSAIMSSTLPWSSLSRLQFTRSFMFLTLVGSTQPVLVPLSIFSADDIEFIKNQFAKNRSNQS